MSETEAEKLNGQIGVVCVKKLRLEALKNWKEVSNVMLFLSCNYYLIAAGILCGVSLPSLFIPFICGIHLCSLICFLCLSRIIFGFQGPLILRTLQS